MYSMYEFDQELLICHDSFNENTAAELYAGQPFMLVSKHENACFRYQVHNNDYTKNEEVSFKSRPLNREIPSCQSLDAPKLVADYQKDRLKGRLKEIASKLNEDDNPVIMLIKHKK